jgi:hypothetical protein
MIEKLKSLLFRAKMNIVHGVDVVDNTGFPTEEVVIRYKDLFIYVYINQDTGEPYDWGWTDSSPLTHVPIKDFYTAVRKGSK